MTINVIDYGQYNRKPQTTTTKKTVTVEEYAEDGKLIRRVVTTTEDTSTQSGYPFVTYNPPVIGTEVKFAGDTAQIKRELDLMD